jgi:hypothetical protein
VGLAQLEGNRQNSGEIRGVRGALGVSSLPVQAWTPKRGHDMTGYRNAGHQNPFPLCKRYTHWVSAVPPRMPC